MSFFDLELKCRTDVNFRSRLSRLIREQKQAQAATQKNIRNKDRLAEVNLRLLKTCHYNLALLTPYYFPSMFEGKPMVFTDYPQIWPVLQWNCGIGYTNIRGSRQIGKTQAIKSSMLMTADMIPGYKQLYFVPLSEQLKIFVDGFVPNYDAFRFKRKTKYRDNLYYKELVSSDRQTVSTLRFSYILTSASKVRGDTQDGLWGDEMQDFDPDLMPEIDEILSASKMPRRIFSGTSLTTTTMLEALHQQGSASTWMVPCRRCGFENWADLDCEYDGPDGKHNVWDMIQPEGPCCIKCGTLLHPEHGTWMHGNPAALDLFEFSFHIPQILVPGVIRNPARWYSIYRKKEKQEPRKFLQENLGIPVEDGEREVSEAQLREICTLPQPPPFYIKQARDKQYKLVVSGVDWGGSDHQRTGTLRTKVSYTVHVIAALRYGSERRFDLIHFRRHGGMNYEEIASMILADHARCKAVALASDVGAGDYYNSLISAGLGHNAHYRMRYVGPDKPYIDSPDTEQQPNTWNLNRSEAISDTFGFIRHKVFACPGWQYSADFLKDILNMRRHPYENETTGKSTLLYRRIPTKPDDTLHAINFAVVLLRLLSGENLFGSSNVFRDFHRRSTSLTVARPGMAGGNTVRRH